MSIIVEGSLRVYLAGDIRTEWRHDLMRALDPDWDWLKPIFPGQLEACRGEWNLNVLNIDLALIEHADVLIAYYQPNHLPIGTTCEAFYAWQRRKPVIILMAHPDINHHPWLRFIATAVFELKPSDFRSVAKPVRRLLRTFLEEIRR